MILLDTRKELCHRGHKQVTNFETVETEIDLNRTFLQFHSLINRMIKNAG